MSLQIMGRTLIHVSVDPVTWLSGVCLLWLHKQLDTIEIGHHALHGAWDKIPELKKLHSKDFKWNTPVEETSWKWVHNVLHHQYANIVGRDPDVNFGLMRLSPKTPWSAHHLLQITQFFITAPFFSWWLNLYFTGLGDLLRPKGANGYRDILPDRKVGTVLRAATLSLSKLIPYFCYEYVLWPVLAGPLWWKVMAGNALADVMRNIYTAASIYAGHFGEDVEYYDKSFRTRGRGEWYKAQIEATHNYQAPKTLEYLCGSLNYQIEHHLFPKLPPNRLGELAPQIKKICQKYGIIYRSDTWVGTLQKAFKRIYSMSYPWPAQPA
jgi:linoleoyl-CoA desaturase